MRTAILKAGANRSKTDGIAEVTILSMLLAWFGEALKSLWNATDSKFSETPGAMSGAMFGILTGPGVGSSMVRFAFTAMRAVISGKANAVVEFIVKNAKATHKGQATFTIGRINPLWGRIFKTGGSDDIRVKGKTLQLLIPKGADKNAEAVYRDFKTVSTKLIAEIYAPKGAKSDKPKTASEAIAYVVGKGGPLGRAIDSLAGKRSKGAKELHTALVAVMTKFGIDASAEKATSKAGKAMRKNASRISKAGKAGAKRDRNKGTVNADASKAETASKAEAVPAS